MEFLLTYGWAIVVGVTAIVALNYYGLLDVSGLSSYIPPYCVMDTGLSCLDHSVTYMPPACESCGDIPQNTLQLRLKNNLGSEIQVVSYEIPKYDKVAYPLGTYLLSNGEKTAVNDPNSVVENIMNYQSAMQKGDRYILDMIIHIKNTGSGLEHNFHATLKGKVE